MRVLILSQYYAPEPIPKPVELADELLKRGHEPQVLTGYPNYPTGELHPRYRPGLIYRERIHGVPVTRTYEFPYHGRNTLLRIANYLSFMFSAPLGWFGQPPFDVMYVWHPPLTVGVAAWLIAAPRGRPFVYDVQDIWPESTVLSGLMKEGPLVHVMAALERFVYRKAAHILVVTEGARQNLIAKGVAADKLSVMPHWVDESVFAQADEADCRHIRSQYAWGSRFVLLFAGNIGMVQGLDTVIDAASQLSQEEDILIALVGDGTDKQRLQAEVRRQGLGRRVQFIERQPQERIAAFTGAADALLVHLRKSALSELVIPTKTFTCLAAGRPIVMAMEGSAAALVRDADAGIMIRPEDPGALADAILRLKNTDVDRRLAMGARGREYVRRHFLREHVVTRYEMLLEDVARRSSVAS